MTSDSFTLASAVVTAAGAQSSVVTSRFLHFVFSYKLGATISSGYISVDIEFRDGAGNWQVVDSFVIAVGGSTPSMPSAVDNFPVSHIRANITHHDAVDAGAAAVPVSIQMEAGR